jgi:hypothetical protein
MQDVSLQWLWMVVWTTAVEWTGHRWQLQ